MRTIAVLFGEPCCSAGRAKSNFAPNTAWREMRKALLRAFVLSASLGIAVAGMQVVEGAKASLIPREKLTKPPPIVIESPLNTTNNQNDPSSTEQPSFSSTPKSIILDSPDMTLYYVFFSLIATATVITIGGAAYSKRRINCKLGK
jgi:hypothetical protein